MLAKIHVNNEKSQVCLWRHNSIFPSPRFAVSKSCTACSSLSFLELTGHESLRAFLIVFSWFQNMHTINLIDYSCDPVRTILQRVYLYIFRIVCKIYSTKTKNLNIFFITFTCRFGSLGQKVALFRFFFGKTKQYFYISFYHADTTLVLHWLTPKDKFD